MLFPSHFLLCPLCHVSLSIIKISSNRVKVSKGIKLIRHDRKLSCGEHAGCHFRHSKLKKYSILQLVVASNSWGISNESCVPYAQVQLSVSESCRTWPSSQHSSLWIWPDFICNNTHAKCMRTCRNRPQKNLFINHTAVAIAVPFSST